MAKKLSTSFLSSVKRAVRMQRRAMKQVTAAITGNPPQRSKKSPVIRSRKPASSSATTIKAASMGGGIWQSLIYKTPLSPTSLPMRLAYCLYRPEGDSSIAGLPLVIMLHGCQQTAEEFARGTLMNRLADRKQFVVAYPQQSKRMQPLRCWRWFKPDVAHGFAEADAIADLARTLVRKYRLDAARVYLAGMSAGAGMAGLVALRHPQLLAAAAMHSGPVLGAAHSAASGVNTMRRGGGQDPLALLGPLVQDVQAYPGLPVVIVHGERDRVVSVKNAVELARQFSYLNGLSDSKEMVLGRGTHREYARHDFLKNGRAIVRLCLLKEVDHAWSGGDEKLKFHSKQGPTASVLMWRFFAMHQRATAS